MDELPQSMRLSGPSPAMTREEYVLFRDYIQRACSIALGEDKKYLLEARLAGLMSEHGCTSFSDFYRKAAVSTDAKLRDRIVDAITTNETLWFRDSSPWEVLRDHILPELAQQVAARQKTKIRVWSAACSTGQEPYSVAMLIDDLCRNGTLGVAPSAFEIVATDISPSALFIAVAGRYDSISMRRGLTGEWERFRKVYFNRQGNVSEVSPELRERVQFRRFNLQDHFASLGRFDIVLLRNVAIYFSAEFKRELFLKIGRALVPGGCLLLGSAESLADQPTLFSMERHGKAYYYRNTRPGG